MKHRTRVAISSVSALRRHGRHERPGVVDDSPGYDAALGAGGSLRTGADSVASVVKKEASL